MKLQSSERVERRATAVITICASIVIAWLAACAGPGNEPEPGTSSREDLPVVDDQGPFDPSEAVDDEDGQVIEELGSNAPQDQEAFADEPDPDQTSTQLAQAPKSADEAGANGKTSQEDDSNHEQTRSEQNNSTGEDEAGQADVPGDLQNAEEGEPQATGSQEVAAASTEDPSPEGETIATEREIAELRQAREQALDQADQASGDDRERKTELAFNPTPDPIEFGDERIPTFVDIALEALLVLVLAAGLTSFVRLGAHFPRTSMLAGALLLGAGIYIALQVG